MLAEPPPLANFVAGVHADDGDGFEFGRVEREDFFIFQQHDGFLGNLA